MSTRGRSDHLSTRDRHGRCVIWTAPADGGDERYVCASVAKQSSPRTHPRPTVYPHIRTCGDQKFGRIPAEPGTPELTPAPSVQPIPTVCYGPELTTLQTQQTSGLPENLLFTPFWPPSLSIHMSGPNPLHPYTNIRTRYRVWVTGGKTFPHPYI